MTKYFEKVVLKLISNINLILVLLVSLEPCHSYQGIEQWRDNVWKKSLIEND